VAVLVEGISVLVREDRIRKAFENDWEAFTATVPNNTLCADGELVRVGFMHPDDVQAYVAQLKNYGLSHLIEGAAADIVVADQQRGLLSACEWAVFGHVNLMNDPVRRVAACMLSESESKQIVTPDDWTFESSLTRSFGFVPSGAGHTMTLIRDEDGLQTWETPLSNIPHYVGRVRATASENPRSAQGRSWLRRLWGRA
jgi:hypothetical protein